MIYCHVRCVKVAFDLSGFLVLRVKTQAIVWDLDLLVSSVLSLVISLHGTRT